MQEQYDQLHLSAKSNQISNYDIKSSIANSIAR